MFRLNEQLEEELLKFNSQLERKYKRTIQLSDEEFLKFLRDHVGELKKLEKPNKAMLNKYEKRGGIVGVDGSVNKRGGAYPHFVELFQGLAACTKNKENMIKKVEVSSPLIDKEVEDMEDMSLEQKDMLRSESRNEILASIEIKVAYESAKKFRPYAILMDGSLLRFHLYTKKLWTEFKEFCEKENILLIGVIEEIKTQIISKEMEKLYTKTSKKEEVNFSAYDKEILFGKLKYGEILKVADRVNTKREWTKGGIQETIDISSAFLRSSFSPSVIGIDIIGSQKNSLEEMASLVLGLTPENSRGIPLWLDLVDKEVRITNNMMEALLEKYINKELYERLFVATRSKRTF